VKDLFDRLRRAFEPPRDRRHSPRRPAGPNRARLAWRAGGQARESTTRLVDISTTGALLVGAELPAPGEAVSIRLEVPTLTDWAEARVVRRTGSGGIGLDFDSYCPYDVFEAVTHGGPRSATVPPGFAGGLWQG
jgi:hypothetical protein